MCINTCVKPTQTPICQEFEFDLTNLPFPQKAMTISIFCSPRAQILMLVIINTLHKNIHTKGSLIYTWNSSSAVRTLGSSMQQDEAAF